MPFSDMRSHNPKKTSFRIIEKWGFLLSSPTARTIIRHRSKDGEKSNVYWDEYGFAVFLNYFKSKYSVVNGKQRKSEVLYLKNFE